MATEASSGGVPISNTPTYTSLLAHIRYATSHLVHCYLVHGARVRGTLYFVRNLGVVSGWVSGVLLIGSISCTMDAVRLTAAAEPQMGYGSPAAVQPAVPGCDIDTQGIHYISRKAASFAKK